MLNLSRQRTVPSAALCALTFVFLTSSPAVAEGPDHTGFHLSVGAGGTWSTTTASVDAASEDATITGAGVGGMLLVGTALAPGLNVGGGTMGGHNFAPKVELGGVETDSDGDLVLNVLGPYVDYYLNPKGGLHLLALAGVATLEDGNDNSDGIALGFGGVVGAGWDTYVADNWSVGALARLHVLRTSNDVVVGDLAVDSTFFTLMPALLVTVTYQ